MSKQPFSSRFLLSISSLILLAGCGGSTDGLVRRSEPIMGTVVEITVSSGKMPQREAERAVGAAFEAIHRVDDLMSTYKPDSEVSRLNAAAGGDAIAVDPWTSEVLAESLRVYRLAHGAFDISVGSVLSAWGFAPGGEKRVPTDAEIEAAMSSVGPEKIELDAEENTVRLAPGTRIVLGGIAKGFAADKAVDALKEHGIANALVNAGGDIYCLGEKRSGNPWKIGIRHPADQGRLISQLQLQDVAVATSGSYENYFESGGTRYSHIIDPRTGRPVREVPSTTVIAPNCTLADALSTSIFVLGPKEGVRLLDSVPGVEGIVIAGAGDRLEVFRSKGWTAEVSL